MECGRGHDEFMREAIRMAQEALEKGEVPIGCVIVGDNEEGQPAATVMAKGRNRTNESRNATRHAEFEAIDQVFKSLVKSGINANDETSVREYFSHCRFYVTVEPCIMCAAALRRIGLTKVYFGCYNERFGGCGSIIPIHKEYIDEDVDPPLQCEMLPEYRKECVELLRHFYLMENERAPVPRKKAKRIFKPVEDEKSL